MWFWGERERGRERERETSFWNRLIEALFDSPILARNKWMPKFSTANAIIMRTDSFPSPLPRLPFARHEKERQRIVLTRLDMAKNYAHKNDNIIGLATLPCHAVSGNSLLVMQVGCSKKLPSENFMFTNRDADIISED